MITSDAFKSVTGRRGWLLVAGWTVARVWVGWTFLTAGLQKVGSPVWTGPHAGLALRGFLGFAISPKMTGGPHPNVIAPYAWAATHIFLPNAAFLSYLVSFSETLVGVALILGLCTRFAALGGLLLNLNYMLAGSAGVNSPMMVIELSIVLVGVTAGVIGVDALIMPRVRGLLRSAAARSELLHRQGALRSAAR